jgi:uncharacterized protein (DUF1800 family)
MSRRLLLLKILLPALLPVLLFAASAQAAGIGIDGAALLLNRTGFTPTLREVREFAGLSREQAARRLIDGALPLARTPPPEWVNDYAPNSVVSKMSPEERNAYNTEQGRRRRDLKAWWLSEMLATPSPLTERMTLLWHGHFATGEQKVGNPVLLYRQNVLLRRLAVGNFHDLLHAILRDPAMLLYLDGNANRKGQPNENLGRELMELFTLGIGRYSEQDVRESARALTGWNVNGETGEAAFNAGQFDAGEKLLLGRGGNFNADDVADILLAQPALAEHISARLWREFISPQPDPAELQRMAALFRASSYDLRVLLQALFTSNAFYAPANRGMLVKSPAELVVGTLRSTGMRAESGTEPRPELQPLVDELAGMGQNLFAPPNVAGWPGGAAWINSNTLLRRKAFLDRLVRAQEKPANPAAKGLDRLQFDVENWFAQFGSARPAGKSIAGSTVARVMLGTEPVPPSPLEQLRELLLDPAYELK